MYNKGHYNLGGAQNHQLHSKRQNINQPDHQPTSKRQNITSKTTRGRSGFNLTSLRDDKTADYQSTITYGSATNFVNKHMNSSTNYQWNKTPTSSNFPCPSVHNQNKKISHEQEGYTRSNINTNIEAEPTKYGGDHGKIREGCVDYNTFTDKKGHSDVIDERIKLLYNESIEECSASTFGGREGPSDGSQYVNDRYKLFGSGGSERDNRYKSRVFGKNDSLSDGRNYRRGDRSGDRFEGSAGNTRSGPYTSIKEDGQWRNSEIEMQIKEDKKNVEYKLNMNESYTNVQENNRPQIMQGVNVSHSADHGNVNQNISSKESIEDNRQPSQTNKQNYNKGDKAEIKQMLIDHRKQAAQILKSKVDKFLSNDRMISYDLENSTKTAVNSTRNAMHNTAVSVVGNPLYHIVKPPPDAIIKPMPPTLNHFTRAAQIMSPFRMIAPEYIDSKRYSVKAPVNSTATTSVYGVNRFPAGSNVHVLRGPANNVVRLPGNAARLPGNVVHLPGNVVHLPGNVVRMPGHLPGNPVNANAVRMPGNLLGNPVNANIVRMPGNLVGNPANATAVRMPGNLVGNPANANIVRMPGNLVGNPANANIVRMPGNLVGNPANANIVRMPGHLVGNPANANIVRMPGNLLGNPANATAVRMPGNLVGNPANANIVRMPGNLVGNPANANIVRMPGNLVGNPANANIVRMPGHVVGNPANTNVVRLPGNLLGNPVNANIVRMPGNLVGNPANANIVRMPGNLVGNPANANIVRMPGNLVGNPANANIVRMPGHVVGNPANANIVRMPGNLVGNPANANIVRMPGNFVGNPVNANAVRMPGNLVGNAANTNVVRLPGNLLGNPANAKVVCLPANVIGNPANVKVPLTPGNVFGIPSNANVIRMPGVGNQLYHVVNPPSNTLINPRSLGVNRGQVTSPVRMVAPMQCLPTCNSIVRQNTPFMVKYNAKSAPVLQRPMFNTIQPIQQQSYCVNRSHPQAFVQNNIQVPSTSISPGMKKVYNAAYKTSGQRMKFKVHKNKSHSDSYEKKRRNVVTLIDVKKTVKNTREGKTLKTKKPWFDGECRLLHEKHLQQLVLIKKARIQNPNGKELKELRELAKGIHLEYLALITDKKSKYITDLESKGEIGLICQMAITSLVDQVVRIGKIEGTEMLTDGENLKNIDVEYLEEMEYESENEYAGEETEDMCEIVEIIDDGEDVEDDVKKIEKAHGETKNTKGKSLESGECINLVEIEVDSIDGVNEELHKKNKRDVIEHIDNVEGTEDNNYKDIHVGNMGTKLDESKVIKEMKEEHDGKDDNKERIKDMKEEQDGKDDNKENKKIKKSSEREEGDQIQDVGVEKDVEDVEDEKHLVDIKQIVHLGNELERENKEGDVKVDVAGKGEDIEQPHLKEKQADLDRVIEIVRNTIELEKSDEKGKGSQSRNKEKGSDNQSDDKMKVEKDQSDHTKQDEEDQSDRTKQDEEDQSDCTKQGEEDQSDRTKQGEEDQSDRTKQGEEDQSDRTKQGEEDQSDRTKQGEEDQSDRTKQGEEDQSDRTKQGEEDQSDRTKQGEEDQSDRTKQGEEDQSDRTKQGEEDQSDRTKQGEEDQSDRTKQGEEDQSDRTKQGEEDQSDRTKQGEEDQSDRTKQGEEDQSNRMKQGAIRKSARKKSAR